MAKYALLVGVNKYDHLPHLAGATKDIEEIRKTLEDPNLGEFLHENIILLEDPDRYTVESAIYELFEDRKKDDLLLFYFAGHGLYESSGQFYLAAKNTCRVKGKLKDITAISAKYLQEKMTQSYSEHQVIILDCCNSGAFSKGMSIRSSSTINLKFLGGKGRAVLTSSTSGQYSFEDRDLGCGIFTHYLIEGIKKGTADLDKDGWISANELHEYVCEKIQEYWRGKGIESPMTPEIYCAKKGHQILIAKAGNVKRSFISFTSLINRIYLDSNFMWSQGESNNSYYLLPENNLLRLFTIGHTDRANAEDSAPIITYAVKGNFEAEIKIQFKSNINYQRAGFGIRCPVNRYEYLRIQMSEHSRIEISVNQLKQGRSLAMSIYEHDVVIFKIQRVKNKFRFFYSPDRYEWLSLGGDQLFTVTNEAELFFDVLSAHNSDEAIASFSDFRVTYI
jgi:regulation of enolase protein 1 (concanavalin A-like superfamily)